VVKSPAPENAVPIHNDHEFSVSSRASALPSMQTVSLYQIGKKRDRTLGEG
jgi:hypothetical protein